MRRTNLQIALTVALGLGAAGGMLIADNKNDGGFTTGGDLVSPPNDDFRSSNLRMAQAGSAPGGCVGDLNDDGIVDGVDLSLLLGAWATSDCEYSLDGDCTIDGADLTILLGNWGPCD